MYSKAGFEELELPGNISKLPRLLRGRTLLYGLLLLLFHVPFWLLLFNMARVLTKRAPPLAELTYLPRAFRWLWFEAIAGTVVARLAVGEALVAMYRPAQNV